VRLVVEGGRKVSDVARDLGIEENMLHRWKREQGEAGVGAFPGKGYLRPQDEEMRQLKRENTDLREERDILKKALAIFSKKPR
jgi:transposase